MRRLNRLAVLALALAPTSIWAQERPAGWEFRFDQPGTPDSAVSFVTMEPGWHLTTGPRLILYDPSMRAEGTYQVQGTIHLFPGPPQEAFGVFIGGANLQGTDQTYTYFVIRGDGHFLIKQRRGTSTPTIHPWTKHGAIVLVATGTQSVRNVLAVDVGADSIAFYINGALAARIPKDGVQTSGIVGLRVNHRLNLHIEELTVTRTSNN
ncbi:MAG TPA: hypothetical protein VGA22_08970 [Gemmatimonadales bacterium]|jgi:hypothetical protein